MDHVPGTGPHRVGMVTPSVESLHNPTQLGFDSTLDAVSRHCEKKLRCQIQSCLDVIKHCVHFRFGRFGDELLFGTQALYCMYILAQDQNGLVRSNTKDLCFSPTQIYSIFPTLVWGRLA